jgi:hypothetical protein
MGFMHILTHARYLKHGIYAKLPETNLACAFWGWLYMHPTVRQNADRLTYPI